LREDEKVRRDEHRTSNIEQPTSNEKQKKMKQRAEGEKVGRAEDQQSRRLEREKVRMLERGNVGTWKGGKIRMLER
jgi:hypothetical protein